MVSQNIYRKINIFFADDLSENVRTLLDAIQQTGLIINADENNKLILNIPDKIEHYEYNKNILQGDACLINLDYATKINESIEKIRQNKGNYDLVICDLYFGDNDDLYADSKIGGIWLIYWAMHLANERKIICKLYSGQLTTVIFHIDFKKALDFIQEAYHITVEEVEKSKDAGSWREHLQRYLNEVRSHIIPEIELNDRVDFINFLATRLHHEHFHNKKEDGRIEDFQKDLFALGDMEFNMIDGRKMKLIHLFPIILGSHFITDDDQNFIKMDIDQLERSLYKSELTYDDRWQRNKEFERLRKEGIECTDFRKHDETGRIIYGIRFTKGELDLGIISQIENSFIQSLDWTFQIHKFYTKQQGFAKWSESPSTSPLGTEEFNRIRNDIVLPSFEKIRECFNEPYTFSGKKNEPFYDQIEYAIKQINEKQFWDKENFKEQTIERIIIQLTQTKLYNYKSKDTILPLSTLFRINIPDFFKIVLNIKESDNYKNYENDEFRRIRDHKFYWYCNAFVVREGLKDIWENMSGSNFHYYILESKYKDKELIKYKIILKHFGRGIPSIVRRFNLLKGENPAQFVKLLNSFCKLTIRSKIEGLDGISFNVYTGKDEVPCTEIKETGTEFEIMFTQGRER